MKKNYLKRTALMAALTLAALGCSDKDILNNSDNGLPQEEKASIVTASTPNGGPNTRLEYDDSDINTKLGVKWEKNTDAQKEQFLACAIFPNDTYRSYQFTRSDDGEAASTADFYTKIYNNNNFVTGGLVIGAKIYALYPSKNDYLSKFWFESYQNINFNLSLKSQKGTLAEMKDFDYMTASGTVTADEADAKKGKLQLQFKHHIAVMRLTGFQIDGVTSGEVTKVTLSGKGLYNTAQMSILKKNGEIVGQINAPSLDSSIEIDGTFTIDENGKFPDIYICFFPGNAKDAIAPTKEITDLKVTATVAEKQYEYSYENDATVATPVTKFKEGNMYTLSGKKLGKSLAIGDYYLKDGTIVSKDESLTPAEKQNCIGIVLKVGRDSEGEYKDDCNYMQKDGTTPMTKVRGYVLALQDAVFRAWQDGGIAWSTKDETSITESDMFNYFVGYTNTLNIKNVAGTDLEQRFPATYKAINYESDCPAPEKSSGWFFPSLAQCKYWYSNKNTIMNSMKHCTGNDSYVFSDFYWSSSRAKATGTAPYFLRFADGSTDTGGNGNSYGVRPIFTF